LLTVCFCIIKHNKINTNVLTVPLNLSKFILKKLKKKKRKTKKKVINYIKEKERSALLPASGLLHIDG